MQPLCEPVRSSCRKAWRGCPAPVSRTTLRSTAQPRPCSFSRCSRSLEIRLQNSEVSDDYRWLHDNLAMLQSELAATSGTVTVLHKLPHVRTRDGVIAPRVSALAQGLLRAMNFEFSEEAFSVFVEAFQQRTVLKMAELWALVPALKLVLQSKKLLLALPRSLQIRASPSGVGACVRSLRDIGQTTWEDVIEPLIMFDHVLRQDPAGAYARMDYDSRNLYRNKIVKIAEYSDCSEMEVANAAIALAGEHARHIQTRA